eukprot:scpid87570/ scgid18877/ 
MTVSDYYRANAHGCYHSYKRQRVTGDQPAACIPLRREELSNTDCTAPQLHSLVVDHVHIDAPSRTSVEHACLPQEATTVCTCMHLGRAAVNCRRDIQCTGMQTASVSGTVCVV